MDIVEKLTRRLAKRGLSEGDVVLQTHGDPVLVEAFTQLGWEDPHSDTPKPAVKPAPEPEPAPQPVVKASARKHAAVPKGKRHVR